MADLHVPEVRSYNMSQIKGNNTRPEILVRKFLHQNGCRYSLHSKKLPGKPDIVLKKYRTVIFVHGCFWHGHDGCKYFVVPKTRKESWFNKISRNKEKDLENLKELIELEWNVIIVYECELKKDRKEDSLNLLIEKLNDAHSNN